MTGFFTQAQGHDFQTGYEDGRNTNSPLDLTVTVSTQDLRSMLEDPAHEARMVGTVEAPQLSAEPLVVSDGRFQLFVDDPEHAGVRNMVYQARLESVEGQRYRFNGYKVVPTSGALGKAWSDTSTLYITLTRLSDSRDDDERPDQHEQHRAGIGILRIKLGDFRRQMTTLRVPGAKTTRERLEAQADFGRFFAGVMVDHYGGVFKRPSELEPEPKARKKRTLDVPDPELLFPRTDDGLELVLTRYRGGSKGPVLLAPGFGMPARSFLLDTVDRNLVEVLVAAEYDVWLFDYRASTDLPSAKSQFTLDDVALIDYPTAVKAVRDATHEEDIQVLGHCMGSLTLLMSLASGLQGVRAALCSQVTLHPLPPLLTRLKAETRLGDLLFKAGVETLSTDFDPGSTRERLFDQAMKLYPTKEGCRRAFCRRVLFQYGEVYKHDQLNDATHEALHEFFGPANLTALKQITLAMRRGQIVDAAGNDRYLPHVDRLKLPIAFLQGETNSMFRPEGSSLTYDLLCSTNDRALYSRHVFPGYSHLDCFFGRNAARDVFPTILEQLERHS